MTNEFSQLGLNVQLLDAIDDAGYKTATPIQVQAIPKVLEGVDLLAAAQTGTGKTAGFTLPILHLLEQREQDNQSGKSRKAGTPACLILTPTRELAAQIKASVDLYGKYLDSTSMVVFGGVSINPQISALRKRIDILIATPGRLLDLCNQRKVDLSMIEIVVLDEADRMLDMGFIHDIKRVMKLLPPKRQTLLFSATFSNDIRTLARNMLDNPAEVSVARRNTASELVEQVVHWVDKGGKRALLSHTITTGQWDQVLVFTRTKHGADKLVKQLIQDGIEAMAIHGNKSQNARTRALQNFKQGSLNVLVATDIAARGLDIDQLSLVVNFELPNVAEDYVHRIGRTGRAGSTGNAISLVNAEELKLLRGIEKLINKKIPVIDVDGFTGHNETAEEISIRRDDNQAREKERRKANPRRRGGNSQSNGANGNRAQSKSPSSSGSASGAAKGNSQRRKRRS